MRQYGIHPVCRRAMADTGQIGSHFGRLTASRVGDVVTLRQACSFAVEPALNMPD